MKLGLQTISWGTQIDDIETLASTARRLDYVGLEFAQRVDTLPPASKLQALLAVHDLELIGLAGGSLSDRVSYAAELKPAYLYADEWDEEAVQDAVSAGFTIGLHPHMYKDIDTITAAEAYLCRSAHVGLVLDTAHQHLAGERSLDGIAKHQSRVVGVHLKDWTDRYGLGPLRFARGFAALGAGQLGAELEALVAALLDASYSGWVVVEQDVADGDPGECARRSREWLRARGL